MSSYPFSEIIILYNPNSTGDSKGNAVNLQRELKDKLLKTVSVRTMATKHAGHAEEIGASYAKKDTKTLLISSSGDGGYNELVNGVLAHPSKHIAVAVLPSGNANDHHHATTEVGLVERIVAGNSRSIDAISVRGTHDGKQWQRYAHSYVGFGLTAYVGQKLTEAELNPINEKWLTLKYFIRFNYVRLRISPGKTSHRYTSVVVANIDRMSKVITLSPTALVDDGKLELYVTRYGSLPKVIMTLLLGSVVGLKEARKLQSVRFNSKKPLQIQCDGEVTLLDSAEIRIETEKKAIRTI